MDTKFCKGCDRAGNCALNCGYCMPGQKHSCKECGSRKHRSAHCNGRLGRCVFKCGHCLPGSDHSCGICGALNFHRTADCPYKNIDSCSRCRTATRVVPVPTPVCVPVSIPVRTPVVLVATPHAVVPAVMAHLGGRAKPVMVGKHCVGFVYK